MDPRRQIPPIHRLLDAPAIGRLVGVYGRDPVTIHLRRAVDEIGGSFRVPDVFAAVGAELLEVGTTTRTRLADHDSLSTLAAAG